MANGLWCTVKCLTACGAACLADTVSPVADIIGAGLGEAKFYNG
jgi:hypothetical protein